MRYYVYVIELNRGVAAKRKFVKSNPSMDTDLALYYVGQTVYDPKIRFKQHKEGGKLSNSYVRDFGIALCPDKYDKYNPIPTRKDAMELEGYLAERLRAKGHGVWVMSGISTWLRPMPREIWNGSKPSLKILPVRLVLSSKPRMVATSLPGLYGLKIQARRISI